MNPTAEMLAQIKLGTDSIIDVCLMDGDDVVVQMERDLFRAWDDARKQGLGGKADDDSSGEQEINSPVAYGERCIGEIGEIPFFEKTGEGEYTTYDCLDSTEIPLTITKSDGSVEKPREGTVDQPRPELGVRQHRADEVHRDDVRRHALHRQAERVDAEPVRR